MDPLSIAASITALVATARKVYGVLSGLTSSIVNAPESVRATLATVSQMKSALIEVQQLIQAVDTLPSTRKALIRLDHIAITFSQCVIVLTKLESLVCHAEFRVSAESNGTGKFATRLRWAFSEREKKVSRLLPQLEAQKSCLTLMVSVLRCQSDIEAVRDRDRLQDTLDMVLQQNESLASRLESLETSLAGDDDRSVRFLDNSSAFDLLDDADSASIQSTLTRPRGSKGRTAGSSLMGFARPFEATLMSSWVYGRVRPTNECDNMSVSSYTLRSKSWSMLSGLSLNDISAIAVFRLPMTINDISRISPDSTFGKMMSGGSERPLPVLVPVTGRREMKVVVVGDPGVNKTRLIHTYVTKRLPNGGQQLLSTVLEQYITTTTIADQHCTLSIFEAGGLEYSDKFRPLLYTDTDVVLACGRIGSPASFDNLEAKWLPEIWNQCGDIPVIVVGIRDPDNDSEDSAADVSTAYKRQGVRIARVYGAVKYMECSIASFEGAQEIFDEAMLIALANVRKGAL